MRARVLLLCVVALLAAAGAVPAQEPEDLSAKEKELADLRARIESHRQRARDLANDEERQLERLHALERERALTAQLLKGLLEKEASIEGEITVLETHIHEGIQRVTRRRERLGERLRSMYMRGRHSQLASLVTADDLKALTTRMRVLTHLARTEETLIDEVLEAQRDLRAQRGELQRRLAEIQLTRSEAEERRQGLIALSDEREGALAGVRRQKQQYEASVREMEAAAQAMEELIARLEREREDRAPIPSTSFADARGRLPWPVHGEVVKGFGRFVHPEFKTVVINKGLNIAAPEGTPIQAVHGGVVEYVDWLPGYGKCIIVNHGDGYYTLYAHASVVYPREGTTVGAGEVIGEVGDTGSLSGSQLYFEVRQGKTPLNPADWLARSG